MFNKHTQDILCHQTVRLFEPYFLVLLKNVLSVDIGKVILKNSVLCYVNLTDNIVDLSDNDVNFSDRQMLCRLIR